MEKKVINVPGVEELAQPQTRRAFLKTLMVAGLGAAAVGSAVLSPKAEAQSSDLEIFQIALLLELLEGTFYQQALDAGVLSGSALAAVTNLRDHEFTHAAFLQSAGADPSQVPGFVFPPESLASQEGVLQLAATLEPVGVGAYLGAAPLIADPSNLEAALSIYGTENDHVTTINNLIGVYPPANTAFKTPITAQEALAAAAPFLASAPGGAAPPPAEDPGVPAEAGFPGGPTATAP